MGEKDCFGSIKEMILPNGLSRIQTQPECRDCPDFRDCLRESRKPSEERKKEDPEEVRRQELIAQMIDLSQVISNEIGSCLLELLGRIYRSKLGEIFLRNLLLFFEIPKESPSLSLAISMSPNLLRLLRQEESEEEKRIGFHLYLILIQRSFPNNRKANMGLIAYEIARLFSSDSRVVSQVLQTLTETEGNQFKRMSPESRIVWLLGRMGFLEEWEALKREKDLLEKGKRNP
ncbi:MAG: hypothetical protein ACUVQ9_09590 [Thermodesulfobacteriota bacterium]